MKQFRANSTHYMKLPLVAVLGIVLLLTSGCLKDFEIEEGRTYNKTFKNGDQYIGQLKGEAPHGFGIMLHSNGSTEMGQWENGMLQGWGTYIGSDNFLAQAGNFKQGQVNGLALVKTVNSYQFGNWSNKALHGQGFEFDNEQFYLGNFQKSLPDDYGVKIREDGKVYAGHWREGKENGQGWLLYNEDEYENAYFKQGEIASVNHRRKGETEGTCIAGNCVNGKGKYQFRNGDVYTGEFIQGLPHCQSGGVLVSTDGTKYTGGFAKGRKSGPGEMEFPNGEYSNGMFQNDKFKYGVVYHTNNTMTTYDKNGTVVNQPRS